MITKTTKNRLAYAKLDLPGLSLSLMHYGCFFLFLGEGH